jgi:Leucine-rich repeat (LRR) protein
MMHEIGGFFGARECNYGLVKTLSLESKSLAAVPITLDRFTNLEVLNMQHNEFPTLPIELAQLTKLMSLDISDNPNFIRFPALLAAEWSDTVVTLDVSNTPWQYYFDWSNESLADDSVPMLINKLINPALVTTIDISGNAFTCIPNFTLAQPLPSLTYIDLSYNNMTQLLPIYYDIVHLWPAMQQLLVSHNQLIGWPLGVDPSLWANIAWIDFSYNNIYTFPKLTLLSKLNPITTRLSMNNNPTIDGLDLEAQGLYTLHPGFFELDVLYTDLAKVGGQHTRIAAYHSISLPYHTNLSCLTT